MINGFTGIFNGLKKCYVLFICTYKYSNFIPIQQSDKHSYVKKKKKEMIT